jgi:hypothetical protein
MWYSSRFTTVISEPHGGSFETNEEAHSESPLYHIGRDVNIYRGENMEYPHYQR